MAIRAISMNRVVDYVSNLDPAKGTDTEAAEATVFKVGTLSARQMAAIKDKATSFKPEKDSEGEDVMAGEFRPNQSIYLMVQFGLRGWERFLDDDGNEVKFETVQRQLEGQQVQAVKPECMNRMGLELMRELSEAIEKLNTPSEVTLGN